MVRRYLLLLPSHTRHTVITRGLSKDLARRYLIQLPSYTPYTGITGGLSKYLGVVLSTTVTLSYTPHWDNQGTQ